MKTVYQTNAEGYFVGPVQADPSPLEPGVWLIPGGIQITAEQYSAALAGMMEGKRVTVEDGQLVIAFPPETKDA